MRFSRTTAAGAALVLGLAGAPLHAQWTPLRGRFFTSTTKPEQPARPKRALDPLLIGAILDGHKLTGAERSDIESWLRELMTDETKPFDISTITAKLAGTGIADAEATSLAKTIYDYMAIPAEGGLKALPTAGASAATDRVYTTADLFSFTRLLPQGTVVFRVVTATAVSGADTAVADTVAGAAKLTADYRAKTAQLLTALNDGGSVALHSEYELEKTAANGEAGGGLNLRGTVARAGTIGNGGDPLFGVTMDLSLFLREAVTSTNPKPSGIAFAARFGSRKTRGGILIDHPEQKTMSFMQLTADLTPRSASVPIGFKYTRIFNKVFPAYASSFQIYGMAGY